MTKQIVSMMLCLILVLGMVPVGARAAETEFVDFVGSDPAESVEFDSPSYRLTAMELEQMETPAAQTLTDAGFTYVDMTASDNLLDIIKDCEGFSPTPYWDYSQWTIGYGTGCGSSRDEVPAEYWDGITEEKAEELLLEHVTETAGDAVNRFFRKIGRQPEQHQFDAMVDFSFALGTAWIYGSRVADYMKNPTTELELVRALGAWCRVDGKVSSPTCNRRMREALMYSYGWYLLPHGDIESELQVVHDGELPMFNYVIYEGNGTTLINTRTDDVNYYINDGKYMSLLRPIRDEFSFAGWQYKDQQNYLMEGHRVKENIRVVAQWEQLPFTDVGTDAWYTTGIAYCYRKGLMSGLEPDLFGIHDNASRAMVVSVLYRMAGAPEAEGETGLSDIDGETHYYTKAVKWAVDNGIVAGYEDGTFKPGQQVSRGEMVAFLYRFAKNIKGADVSAEDQLSQYEDKDTVPGYAVKALNWALSRNLIRGLENNLLGARETAARSQLAKVLMGLDNLEITE